MSFKAELDHDLMMEVITEAVTPEQAVSDMSDELDRDLTDAETTEVRRMWQEEVDKLVESDEYDRDNYFDQLAKDRIHGLE